MICAIAAIDNKRGIASNNTIPWDIPKDRQYFKRMTINHTVVMGRITYQTLNKPLPNRLNIVLTSQFDLRPGFKAVRSVAELTNKYDHNFWVIGGQQIYQALFDVTDKLFLTTVDGDFNCNRFLPGYNKNFKLTFKSKKYTQNGYKFRYEHWAKKHHKS